MIGGIAPEESWKKNFRMTRNEFHELADQPRPAIAKTKFAKPQIIEH